MKILLDCDGVLADFTTAYSKAIEELTGFQYKYEDFTNFDHLSCVNLQCIQKDIKKILYKKGWCRSIEPYREALDYFKTIQKLGEIIIVTTPIISPYWIFERAEWLNKYFGIRKDNLIFAKRKELVQGDVFIDDRLETVKEWQKENIGIALLFDRPWNRHGEYHNRIYNWNDIINKIEDYKLTLETYRWNNH